MSASAGASITPYYRYDKTASYPNKTELDATTRPNWDLGPMTAGHLSI